MSAPTLSPFLHRALLLDAIASGATALLLILFASYLTDLLGLPVALLRSAGLILVPFVAFVVWAATGGGGANAIRAIIAANVAWVVASIVLLLGSWVDPTALGYAFVIAQALVVGLFAELQVMGLRKHHTVAV